MLIINRKKTFQNFTKLVLFAACLLAVFYLLSKDNSKNNVKQVTSNKDLVMSEKNHEEGEKAEKITLNSKNEIKEILAKPQKPVAENKREKAVKNEEQINTDFLLKKPQTKKSKIKTEIKYLPRLDLNYKYSNDRRLGRLEGFVPVWQNDKSLAFIDLRGWLDSDTSREGNYGVGFRKIINDELIMGIYGFYDYKITEYNNAFDQATFGVEALTKNWDFRTNIYLPRKKVEEINRITYDTPKLQGYSVSSGEVSYEFSRKGFDVEVGRAIPKFENLKLFGSYYHFENHNSDFIKKEKIDGYKIKAHYLTFSHNQHNLFFETEYSYDNLRKETIFYGLKYRFNFGESSSRKNKLNALEKRMTDEVVRDIDVMVETLKNQPIAFNDSNRRVIYVDNTNVSAGNGTIENRFKTMADAINFSREGDIIYVFFGDGTNNGNNSQYYLKDNQKLIGQAVDFKLSTIFSDINPVDDVTFFTGDTSKYSKVAQAIPTYGTQEAKYAIYAANNNLISGLEIGVVDLTSNPSNEKLSNRAIDLTDAVNLTLHDNIVNGGVTIRIEKGVNLTSTNIITKNVINDYGANANAVAVNVSNSISNVEITNIISGNTVNTGGFLRTAVEGDGTVKITNSITKNNVIRGTINSSSSGSVTLNNELIDNNFGDGSIYSGNVSFVANGNSIQNNKIINADNSLDNKLGTGTFTANNNSVQNNDIQYVSFNTGNINIKSNNDSNQTNNFANVKSTGTLSIISSNNATNSNVVTNSEIDNQILLTASDNSIQDNVIRNSINNDAFKLASNSNSKQINFIENGEFNKNGNNTEINSNGNSIQDNTFINNKLRATTFNSKDSSNQNNIIENNDSNSLQAFNLNFNSGTESNQINDILNNNVKALSISSNGNSAQENNLSGNIIANNSTFTANNDSIQTNKTDGDRFNGNLTITSRNNSTQDNIIKNTNFVNVDATARTNLSIISGDSSRQLNNNILNNNLRSLTLTNNTTASQHNIVNNNIIGVTSTSLGIVATNNGTSISATQTNVITNNNVASGAIIVDSRNTAANNNIATQINNVSGNVTNNNILIRSYNNSKQQNSGSGNKKTNGTSATLSHQRLNTSIQDGTVSN